MLPTLSRLLWLWCSSSTPIVPVDTYLIQAITYMYFILSCGKWFLCCLASGIQFSSISSVAQSCPTLCNPHGLQHTRLPCPSPTPRACSNSFLLSWWCHPTSSSSVTSFPSAFILSQHQGLFQRVDSSQQVAEVLKLQLQHQFFQWIFRTNVL